MEPFAAVGFTAAVVQLLDFSIKAAKTVKQVRERGSSSNVENTDYIASHLSSLSDSVQTKLQLSGIHQTLSAEENELLEIGRKCGECSRKLQTELEKLKATDGARSVDRLKVAARTIWRKGDIEKLQDKLENTRQVLETRLLYTLR